MMRELKNFQFLNCFEERNSNYKGGRKILASLIIHESGDLSPQNEISTTCNRLRRQGKLHGSLFDVLITLCDLCLGFRYEKHHEHY